MSEQLIEARRLISRVESPADPGDDPVAYHLQRIAEQQQHGHVPSLRHLHIGEDYCSFYWDGRKQFYADGEWLKIEHGQWISCARLLKAYHDASNLVDEAKVWFEVEGSRIYWMDNSVEVTYMSAITGETRRVQEKAPSGDLCY